MPDTGPGGPEGRRRRGDHAAGQQGRGPCASGAAWAISSSRASWHRQKPRPGATPRRLGCRGHSALPFKLPCWPAPLALQHPPGTRQGGWPGLRVSRHRGPVRGRAPESLSKWAARGPREGPRPSANGPPMSIRAASVCWSGHSQQRGTSASAHQRVLN